MNTLAAPVPAISGPELSQDTFERFRKLIYEKTKINMRETKRILVANRLRKRINALELDSFEEYLDLLTGRGDDKEIPFFVDAVSTNETYFYREDSHFDSLRSAILPEMFRTYGRLRIWSAGCSTGEEVYTLRMVTDRAAKAAGAPSPEIIGTDISTEVIRRARDGIYGERSVRLLPSEYLDSEFVRLVDGKYQISEELRSRVEFRVHNLFVDPPPPKAVHIVFCRNVMIYFDKATQLRLVDEIFAPAIVDNGYLFIGHSESLNGLSTGFRYLPALKAPVYQKRKEEERGPRNDC